MMFLVLYIVTAFLVALLARRRGLNTFAYFLLALILTPIIPLLFLLLTQNAAESGGRKTMNVTCPKCTHELRHLKDIGYCSHCGVSL